MSETKSDKLNARIVDWLAAARRNRLFPIGLAIAGAVALLDQVTKNWIVHRLDLPGRGKIEISSIFDLTYVQNYGASFGMLSGGLASRILLSVIAAGVAFGLLIWLGRLRRPVAAIGVGFVVGGALGNLYDRLAYGYVVDFLDFSGLYFPWVFNVADMGINVGIAFLLLDAWQTRHDDAGSEK